MDVQTWSQRGGGGRCSDLVPGEGRCSDLGPGGDRCSDLGPREEEVDVETLVQGGRGWMFRPGPRGGEGVDVQTLVQERGEGGRG